jgi:hypothetical protein
MRVNKDKLQMSKFKGNCIALIIGIGLSVLLCELILRIYPPDFMSEHLWRQYDEDIGWKILPTASGLANNGCIVIKGIKVNDLGFRDKEWSSDERYKIAVLGDSYMEGQHLPEGTLAPQVLERLLHVPVLNAGLEGAGTVQEYLVYKKYLAPYKPQSVLLFMYPYNDIQDNSKALANSVMVWPQAFTDPSGHIAVHYPETPPETEPKVWAVTKQYVKTILMLRRGYQYWQNLDKWTPNVYLGGVYLPEDEKWQEAWKITEHYLVELKKAVEHNDGRLFVVVIPEYIQISHDWERELLGRYGLKELPPGFSKDRHLQKLAHIAKTHDIPLIPLDVTLRQYRDKDQLPAPYFYYRCDGHLNPLGHFLAANVVAKYLLDRAALSLANDSEKAIRSMIERNLNLGPQDILSEEGYSQIYRAGRFYGKTNIPSLN